MSWIDWIVFASFLTYVVVDGIRKGRGTKTLEDYFAGGRSIPWWAAGLSIMATQASAITVIGTTGQGYESGMEFVQIYLGLAFAMVLLSIFFVPMYRRSPILTAYEYLEERFDARTRTMASIIFLLSRCLAFGVVIYAPAVVMSALLEVDLLLTVLFIGVLTTIYTMLGGVKAVIATDVKQMTVIIGGLVLVLIILLVKVVPTFGFFGVLDVLGATGKLNAVEFEPASTNFWPRLSEYITGPFDRGESSFWNDKYNFWSGTFGGLFLMLSYFGCDQTQVQRILTNATADESRKALLLSAFAKVPMQAVVLFIGVMLYAFYVIEGSPLLFNPNDREAVKTDQSSPRYAQYKLDHDAAKKRRKEMALRIAKSDSSPEVLAGFRESTKEIAELRKASRHLVLEEKEGLGGSIDTRKTPKDTNYIFPAFLLDHVPVVLLGLMMAAIFAAMMSSADSALNALTASSVVDIYKRWFNPGADEAQSLFASKVTTVFWGVAATGAAFLFQGTGSVIEVVNKVGSFFYGSLLGVFVLGLASRHAGPTAGFLGLIGGMVFVLVTHLTLDVQFLWYNVIGCVGVLLVGGIATLAGSRRVS